MRRYLFIAIVGFALVCSTDPVPGLFSQQSRAQTQSASPGTPQPAKDSDSQPATPVPSPTLQCQGCHGPGKTLPYLGGAQFHTSAHAEYDKGFHARAVRNGFKAAVCLDCHSKNRDLSAMLPASDPSSTIHRANISETCGRCHGDKSVMQGSGISDRPFLSYRESVHAQAIARGNISAAVCTDCHKSHDIRAASDPQSSISKIQIPSTCGQCHRSETAEFTQSVHGEAVARGVSRSPSCTDCHGIHSILNPSDTSTASKLATGSCAQCHEGVALTREFGVAGGRVASYKDSYHGLASRLGSKVVADCASCHGVHNILPSSDSRSMIHPANLAQTCGQCHVGAGENFTRGKIHLNVVTTFDTSGQDPGVIGTTWVRRIYLPLIVFTIGGMAIHNLLIWRKKAADKRRREKRTVLRLTGKQRVQHWLLLTSFIALVLSGFALQYPDSWLAWTLGGSELLRRTIHRVAAVVMLAVGVYHLAYLGLTKEGREWVRDMTPRVKDVRDLIENFAYYLGLKQARPKIARFGYAEKAEYWAVVWGTIIMGLTGLMIWFKLGWFGFLPRWAIEVALAVHLYEAVLATLAIVVWHFYHVIFDPDVYPVNWAFYDGRISEEAFKEEHELAYELTKEQPQDKGESEPDTLPASTQAD
jgi:formate dehydrogenase gamma subunit